MSSPEHFRIDCLIPPFTPRIINDLQFLPAFDNPLKPMTPTGLHHVGPLHQHQLALYAGLDEHFPITRLGVDEVSAYEAHEQLKKERAATYLPKKPAAAAPAPVAAPAPAPGATPTPQTSDDAAEQQGGQQEQAQDQAQPQGDQKAEQPPAPAPAAKGKAAKDAK